MNAAIGIALLIATAWIFARVRPREGKPAPAWVRGEFGSMVLIIGLMCMALGGVAMIAQDIG